MTPPALPTLISRRCRFKGELFFFCMLSDDHHAVLLWPADCDANGRPTLKTLASGMSYAYCDLIKRDIERFGIRIGAWEDIEFLDEAGAWDSGEGRWNTGLQQFRTGDDETDEYRALINAIDDAWREQVPAK